MTEDAHSSCDEESLRWRLGCGECGKREFWIYVDRGEVQAICTSCGTWTHDFTPHERIAGA